MLPLLVLPLLVLPSRLRRGWSSRDGGGGPVSTCVVLGLVLPRWALVAVVLAGVPGGPPVPGVSLMASLLKVNM